jgi:hypothetical protein
MVRLLKAHLSSIFKLRRMMNPPDWFEASKDPQIQWRGSADFEISFVNF